MKHDAEKTLSLETIITAVKAKSDSIDRQVSSYVMDRRVATYTK